MAEIKDIYNDAERTEQIYPRTHEKAVIDDNGTPLNSKLGAIVDLVNQKQMAIGAVPIDITPKNGSTDHVVSSDGIFKEINVGESPSTFWYTGSISGSTHEKTDSQSRIITAIPCGNGVSISVDSGYYVSIQQYSSVITDVYDIDGTTWLEGTSSWQDGTVSIVLNAQTKSLVVILAKGASQTDLVSISDSTHVSITLYEPIKGVVLKGHDTFETKNTIALPSAVKGYPFGGSYGSYKWQPSSYEWYGYFIPCSAGDEFSITASTNIAIIGWLSNNTVTFNSASSVIGARIDILGGDTQVAVAPTGANFLYITKNTSDERTPSSVKKIEYLSYSAQIQDLQAEINDSKLAVVGYVGSIRAADDSVGVSTACIHSDILPLNGASSVTCKMSNEDAIPSGYHSSLRTSYYDSSKTYIGYTNWTNNETITLPDTAKYVRMIFTLYDSNDTQISDYTLSVFDSIGFYLSINKNVQTIAAIVSSEVDKDKISNADWRSKGGIVVGSWNIGHFSFGGSPDSTVTSSDYAEKKALYTWMVDQMDSDIIALSEYSANFYQNEKARDLFFQDMSWGHVGTQNQYACQAAFVNKQVTGTSDVNITSVTTTHYYTLVEFLYMGKTVKLCSIHFQANAQQADDSGIIAQFNEIVNTFANDQYVIIAGDFNLLLMSSLSVFTNAGYTLANGGAWGNIETYTHQKGTLSNYCFDNIATKGFYMKDVKVIPYDLSDHYPIMAKLMLKQN